MFYKYQDEVADNRKNILLVREVTGKLLVLLSPIAPFITEELWLMSGNDESIHKVKWPGYDSEIAKEEITTIVFQVNGRLRDKTDLPVGTSGEKLKEYALSSEKIRK